MTQAPETKRWPLPTIGVPPVTREPDRQLVCEIVGLIAAEVLSEVEAGTWRPPTTLRRSGRHTEARRVEATDDQRRR